jgi:hypothetical protein
METMHGWYSAKMAAQFGHHVYRAPDGGTVEVTEVGSRPECEPPPTGWGDWEYRGLVTEWVRNCPPPGKFGAVPLFWLESEPEYQAPRDILHANRYGEEWLEEHRPELARLIRELPVERVGALLGQMERVVTEKGVRDG